MWVFVSANSPALKIFEQFPTQILDKGEPSKDEIGNIIFIAMTLLYILLQSVLMILDPVEVPCGGVLTGKSANLY